ncbi:MAG: peptidylprolyl isomerase, partial [Candidatus Krumholzibacteriota bacterium]|nr:peptidylprolyl isomerase [Candidatus Krumholzibacteriota bacterium]
SIKAIEALARIGGGKCARAIEKVLEKDDNYIKTVALRSLTALGEKGSFKKVLPLLEDKSPMVRRAALEAAAATGKIEARKYVLQALQGKTRYDKQTALECLGSIGAAEDLPLLVEILSTGTNHLFREGAAAGLGKWEKRDELMLPAGKDGLTPVGALLAAADGEDWVVATMAVEALGSLETDRFVDRLAGIYAGHHSRLDSDRKLALVNSLATVRADKGISAENREKITGLFQAALTESDPRIPRAAAAAAQKWGLKFSPDPQREKGWNRGETPWREPELPLGTRQILLRTSRGEIEIELFGDDAPAMVLSMITLAKQGFYNGLNFHRVVPGFVIQGGCPRGDGWGDAGYFLRSQFNSHRYQRGMVGMAHAGKDTAGSQFFITHCPQPHLDGRYTIIGRVTRGMEVVDRIETGDTFGISVIE